LFVAFLSLFCAYNDKTKELNGQAKGPKLNDDECVSQLELKEMMRAMTETFKKYQDSTVTSYEKLDRQVAELVTRMDVLEARPPPHLLQPQLTLLWTMTTMFMHHCDNASHVIDKVWEVMVDVVIIFLNQTIIHLLRLSSLFHRSWVLMMLKLT
jgi:hypothetical protein